MGLSLIDLVLLAGGRGRRLGGCLKPLLRHPDGTTLLESVAIAYAPLASTTYLTAPADVLMQLPALGVAVTDPGEGPLRALAAAALVSTSEWLLCAAADHPRPSRALAERLLAERSDQRDAVFVMQSGHPQVGLGAFRRAAVLDAQQAKFRAAIAQMRALEISAESLPPELLEGLEDVDEEADLARFGLLR